VVYALAVSGNRRMEAGAILRPHFPPMREKGEKAREILEASRLAGCQLVREGSISPGVLQVVSQPLMSQEDWGEVALASRCIVIRTPGRGQTLLLKLLLGGRDDLSGNPGKDGNPFSPSLILAEGLSCLKFVPSVPTVNLSGQRKPASPPWVSLAPWSSNRGNT